MRCDICGHPNIDTGRYMPHPDPRFLHLGHNEPRCMRCERPLLISTHHWEGRTSQEFLCCTCYRFLQDEAAKGQPSAVPWDFIDGANEEPGDAKG